MKKTSGKSSSCENRSVRKDRAVFLSVPRWLYVRWFKNQRPPVEIRGRLLNPEDRASTAVFLSFSAAQIFAFCAFIGFLLRFLVSCQLIAADPAVYAPSAITDMRTYCDLADSILSGIMPQTFYYQPFYYSIFLPLNRLLTTSPYMLALTQSLLGGVVIYLAGRIGERIAGVKAGFFGALLCAFSSILIYFTPYALLEIVQSFWITAFFFVLLLALERKKLFYWCVAGVVLGCSILTRGNTWCFLPLILLAAYYSERRIRRVLLVSLILIVFTLLPQFPFAVYNTVKTGTLSGPSTAGGAVLCIGNNPESAPGGLDIPYPPTYEAWMASEKHVSIPRRMLDWMEREPAAFLELQWNKFLLFWHFLEYPNNISEYNAKKSSLMRTFVFLPTGILLALGIAGGFSGFYRRFFRRRKEFLLLWGMILLYAVSVSCFYILARFRVPILPLICVSGGVFLSRFLRRMNRRKMFYGVLILLLGVVMAYFVYPAYSTVYEPWLMRSFRPSGVQSQLSLSRFLIQDHTQRIRGSWGIQVLKDGMVIEKTFVLPDRGGLCGAVLELPVEGTDFSCVIEINGVRRFVDRAQTLSVPLPAASNEKQIVLTLRIRDVRGEPLLYFDLLREYGRTRIDGKPVGYELVASLFLEYNIMIQK